ncbi:MAG: hypothetical protein ABSE56_23095 [Bryobacteraceae bacterium]|jgi:hypothetical protein
MLITLELKDYLGPAVSLIAAAFSFWFSLRSHRHHTEDADRSINVEGQKLLVEVNRHLIDDPRLWGILDDHEIRQSQEFTEAEKSPLFRAKLQAFAHLGLNMFEIILAESPNPKKGERTASHVWRDFFTATVKRSSLLRAILEHPESANIYQPALLALYDEWRRQAPAATIGT